MKASRGMLAGFAGITVVALAVVACGSDDPAPDAQGGSTGADTNSVTVLLRNWAVEPSVSMVQAGTVRITATHEMEDHGSMDEGGATHQLLIAPLPDDAEPGTNSFGAPIILNITDLEPGESETQEVELTAGRYELACLLSEEMGGGMDAVNHYEKGMFAVLEVE